MAVDCLAQAESADSADFWSSMLPRGYLKSYLVYQPAKNTALQQSSRTWQSQSNLRLIWDGSSQWAATPIFWEIHYELTPQLSSQTLAPVQAPGASDYRLSDLQTNLTQAPRRLVGQNLDRLNVQLRFDHGDLTLGRQPINFGTARLISPTDVLLPFNVQTRNTEYRFGVDALRYQRPVGQLGEIDTGVILGENLQGRHSAAYMHLKANLQGQDLEFTALRFANQLLVGGGLHTALGSVGYWFEGASVSAEDHYWRISTGVDYALSERLLGVVEYHYNGAGAQAPTNYMSRLSQQAYTHGGVFLLGQQYLIPALSWQASALLTVAAQTILNLNDNSAFLTLQLDYNLTENTYLGLGLHGFFGKTPSVVLSPVETGTRPTSATAIQANSDYGLGYGSDYGSDFGSEYGPIPDNLFVSFSYYF